MDYNNGQGKVKAEITVYLSLVFILLLSFVASMLESASIQNAKNYRRADTNRAIESVFAEYQKVLLDQYDIFALEGSYETGQYKEDNVLDRLSFYGAGSMKHEVKKIQYLTDNGCQPFYDQVTTYMLHKYGASRFQDQLGGTMTWKQQEKKGQELGREEQESKEKLEEKLEENEATLPNQDNPISHVDGLKQTPLLDLVMPKDKVVSSKSLNGENLLTHRTLNRGYGDFSKEANTTGAVSKILFGAYLLEHFSDVTAQEHTGVLDYEMEYMLAGKESDKENLETVVKKLMMLRFVPNYIYIQTDSEMKAEAQAMALALCSVVALPVMSQAVSQAILLAWAFGETVVDIRALLSGHKVAPVKSKASWQLQLSSLLTLGTEQDGVEGKDEEGGQDYGEYLGMLLFLEKGELIALRTLTLAEQTLRQEKGLVYFKVDQCISRIQIETTCPLRRGIKYQFHTYFGYN